MNELCPCNSHEIEFTTLTIGPFWAGDEPQPILVCPETKSVVAARYGYLSVPPGEEPSNMNYHIHWALLNTDSKDQK